jgi:hypothetical protein
MANGTVRVVSNNVDTCKYDVKTIVQDRELRIARDSGSQDPVLPVL